MANLSIVQPVPPLSRLRRSLGWSIHIFTASGAGVALFALLAISEQQWLRALWLMGGAILIDAVDGMFARLANIKQAVPRIDGALLDNIVDFVNYTIVPAFFLLMAPLLPPVWPTICALSIIFSSAYQFTQVDAKTQDHFFKGFPSYWNIVVFYLFFWQMHPMINVAILLVLAILSFVPIKYIYPSRVDYLSNSQCMRFAMVMLTILWGMATTGLLWFYPRTNPILVSISMGYLLIYIIVSLYRTWIPLTTTKPAIMHTISNTHQ